MLQGLDVEPTAEGMAFGSAIDRIIGSNQAEGRTVTGAPEANLDEGGVTDYVLAGRERRYQPNVLPASQRPIRFSTDEQVVGLTLAQTGELPAGAVVAIGGAEDVFPTEVYSKLTTDLGTWAKRYMPEARIVLNLEQFAPSACIRWMLLRGGYYTLSLLGTCLPSSTKVGIRKRRWRC